MDHIGERYQRTILRGRKDSIIHGAETIPTDSEKMKALNGLDGLRGQGRQDSQSLENILAVRLDGFAPKGGWRAWLSLQNEDGNPALRKGQAQDRPTASRSHHYDLELHCQPRLPKPS